MAKLRKTPRLSDPSDDLNEPGPVAEGPGAGDTSAADARYAEHEQGDRSPINSRVVLRLVTDFKLQRRDWSTGKERRFTIHKPAINPAMTEEDVFKVCGQGEYVLTWFRRSTGKTGGSQEQRFYSSSVVTVGDPTEAAHPGGVGGTGVPPGPGQPGTIADGERLVPASMRLDEQWYARWVDDARADRAELVGLVRGVCDTIAGLAQRASEQNAQIIAMSGNMVQAMHASGERDLMARTQLAQQIVEMERGGGIEKMLMPIVQRVADRMLPAGGAAGAAAAAGASPDRLMKAMDTLERLAPQVQALAEAAPALQAMQGKVAKLERLADQLAPTLGAGGDPAMSEPDPAAATPVAPTVIDE